MDVIDIQFTFKIAWTVISTLTVTYTLRRHVTDIDIYLDMNIDSSIDIDMYVGCHLNIDNDIVDDFDSDIDTHTFIKPDVESVIAISLYKHQHGHHQ